ncbi:MAG: hypothetical protein O7G31_09860 [Calditrichaeota bacterium]|nr:hypothetical protein [Calditrichota bacterium]
MSKFYGAYGLLTGVFVSLSLSLEMNAEYRTLFTVLDVLLIGHLCLLNTWFRNFLIGWTDKISKEIHG